MHTLQTLEHGLELKVKHMILAAIGTMLTGMLPMLTNLH